ncbi:TIR domain-containing protein [Shinella kummerowiae]|uniref:TIR domain-containing protein n=1 Tax=Shinella kummerowiae TaxID=417745 RepID=A0A6N8SK01_9HYPH|nr:SEFIR domain-containing protein [Shinella kummerowiae]MXN47202.1 TIR domain-containing protein [Shinella kummerowiae]
MPAETTEPRLFISYSWSNQDHEAWVIGLAEELVSQGVHVVLDKWDLQPGHDANDFMESMVKDKSVTKVILICDEIYAAKSDDRKGGAGTEAQIITPKIYASAKQDKFVAVVRERDAEGKPFLPTYYGGRIYFDLSNPARYAEEFEKIVRWAWNKPLHVRPAQGAKPSFLNENASVPKIAGSVAHRRAMDGMRSGAANAAALAGDYLETISSGLEKFRIQATPETNETFDEIVLASIDAFTPHRNELIELFSAAALYAFDDNMVEAIHRFFERCLPYYRVPQGVNSYSEWDYDNYRFIVHEAFLYCVAIFIKYEKFGAAAYFANTDYYEFNRFRSESGMKSFSVFDENLRSLEFRNKRLNLRRYSLRADMLKERNQGSGVAFQHLQAADFVFYLRSVAGTDWNRWWPETLLYADRHGGPFEMFARGKSMAYFERLKPLLGFSSVDAFKAFIAEIVSKGDRVPKWDFDRVNVAGLAGINTLGTTP